MIYSGSNAIADVKLGSRQVAAVYRGADLIWEKDEELITLKIGTQHADDDAGMVLAGTNGLIAIQSAGQPQIQYSFYGFSIISQKLGNTMTYDILHAFDSITSKGYAESNYESNATTFYCDVVFPFNVNVINVTGYKHTIYVYGTTWKQPKKLNVLSHIANSNFDENVAITDSAENFDSSGIALVTATKNNTNIRALRFMLSGYPTGTDKRTIGELKMEIQVKASDYRKWKRDNGLTSNTNIP